MGRRAGRRRDPFREYLQSLTLRTYVRDYFLAQGHRAAVGVVIGVLFVGYGLARLVTDPGPPSLGIVLLGLGVTLFCLVAPLLAGLFFALIGRGAEWVDRRRGSDLTG